MANPIGQIWAGAMMLEHLGETEAAGLILRAIQAVLTRADVLTPDLGGTARTVDLGRAICEAVRQSL